jgi:DNA-directed RNA polymerase specialized sigma24 family protein
VKASREAIKDDLVRAIPSLRAFAISVCGNSERADDLVQETLVKAWAKLASFTQGTNHSAWLFTILRNAFCSEMEAWMWLEREGMLAPKLGDTGEWRFSREEGRLSPIKRTSRRYKKAG